MVNDVINAVTQAIAAEFPPEEWYEIYIGDVPQDFEPRNFIVSNVTAGKDKKTHVTYEYNELISIQYRPQGGEIEINDALSRLMDCLEIITVNNGYEDKPTQTVQTDSAVVDGILTYMIRVSDVYFRLPEGDKMENTSIGIGVSNG